MKILKAGYFLSVLPCFIPSLGSVFLTFPAYSGTGRFLASCFLTPKLIFKIHLCHNLM
jgi:hypothetical protein